METELQHDLRARLETHNSFVMLTHTLLTFCRDHVSDYRAARNASHYIALGKRTEKQALLFFTPLRNSSTLPDDARSLFWTLFDFQTADIRSLVVQARAVAVALDKTYGHTFVHDVRDQARPGPLQPGDPVPLNLPPLKAMLGKDIGSQPESLDPQPYHVPHLRLAPAGVLDFQVYLRYEFLRPTDRLFDDSRTTVGTASLNETLESLTWVEREENGVPYVSDVRPRQGDVQLRAMRAILEAADHRVVSILVYPELCATRTEIDALAQTFRERADGYPRLLVAGSTHEIQDAVKVNQAYAYVRGVDRPITHRKFAEFSIEGFTEDIYREPRPRLDVYYTREWSFLILICKDFLSATVQDLLRYLGVHLILVPALTFKIAPFVGLAQGLTAAQQSIVIIANNPRMTRPLDPEEPPQIVPTAVFSIPRASVQLHTESPSTLPALCTHALATGQTEVHPV
jgi:hypothetical protein